MSPDDPRHGTYNGYNNLNCRCDRCRAAWAAYEPGKRARERYRRRLGMKPREQWIAENMTTEHGRPAVYKRGCRCDVCREAVALRRRAHRRKNGARPVPGRQKYPEPT